MKKFLILERKLSDNSEHTLVEAWFSSVYGPFVSEEVAISHIEDYGNTVTVYVVVFCYQRMR